MSTVQTSITINFYIDHDQLLQLLLMFVSSCVDVIRKAPPSVPGISSALRYQLNMKYLKKEIMAAFDHPLLAADKAGSHAGLMNHMSHAGHAGTR
jgi:hypothetical protein